MITDVCWHDARPAKQASQAKASPEHGCPCCCGAAAAVLDVRFLARTAGDDLASSFSRFVNQQGKLQEPLRHRHPSPLLSPQMVVAAQMDALQVRAATLNS